MPIFSSNQKDRIWFQIGLQSYNNQNYSVSCCSFSNYFDNLFNQFEYLSRNKSQNSDSSFLIV